MSNFEAKTYLLGSVEFAFNSLNVKILKGSSSIPPSDSSILMKKALADSSNVVSQSYSNNLVKK